jgi:hypothetical protein
MKFATIFTSLFDELSEAASKKTAEVKLVLKRIKAIKVNLDTLESAEPFEEMPMAA